MTTAAQLRKTAATLPGAALGEVDGLREWSVDGTGFAGLDAESRVLLRLPETEAADMIAQVTGAEAAEGGVRVPIGAIDGQALNYWLRRAWLAAAPLAMVEAANAAANARAGEVGDLPRGIGRPATRALADAGITTLDQVEAMTDAELTALHGVGPKTVRVLRETIAQR
ncbi:helix-hairpin-helix domain-containing protein [Glycomyces sp. NPDC046736]|uniref:helix-hairpin-helix domain-containing protein n=1 Tax=Glycomyces sp. NPDC046736 TaxID=3155615 RepID=UPI0033FD93C3